MAYTSQVYAGRTAFVTDTPRQHKDEKSNYFVLIREVFSAHVHFTIKNEDFLS